MMPILMSNPRKRTVVKAILQVLIHEADAEEAKMRDNKAQTRLLCCLHCTTALCTGAQIAGLISDLNANPREDTYLVHRLANVNLLEDRNSVSTALLHNGATLILQAVSCSSCHVECGHRLIGYEGADEQQREVTIGQCIVKARNIEVP